MAGNNKKGHDISVGWIGLGNMGLAMATNLQNSLRAKKQPALCYTNRTMSRGEALAQLGGVPYEKISDVVQHAGVIFTSVSNDEVLLQVVAEIVASGSITDKIVVDTTTVLPETTATISSLLVSHGAKFVAAPVFGATPVARQGKLLMAVAGAPSTIEIISPFLEGVLARSVINVGEDAAKASLLKTAGNFITAGLAETISEAHVFAEKSGLGCNVLEELIRENYGAYAYSVSAKLTSGAYAPPRGEKAGSDVNLAIKDVGHAVTSAKDAGVQLEVGELTLAHLRAAVQYAEAQGGRPLDSSSVYGIIRQGAGLDFETGFIKTRDADGSKDAA